MDDLGSWFLSIPPVTRTFLSSAVLMTTACFLEAASPLTLYYNSDLIFKRGQYWRLVSSFLFFGTFSLDFLFHMYFVARYCKLLEDGCFRGRLADFLWMLTFGAGLMIVLCFYTEIFGKIKFLGHSLSFMMVYIWGRAPENQDIRMSLLGLITFNAPYLPLATSQCACRNCHTYQ